MANRIISSTCEILREFRTELWQAPPDKQFNVRSTALLRIRRHLVGSEINPDTHPNPAVREAWHYAQRALSPVKRRRRPETPQGAREAHGMGFVTRLERRQSVLVRNYRERVRAFVRRWMVLGAALTPKMVERKMEGIAFAKGRAQWRRWYKANRLYQRRLGALKQLGYRCPPGLSSLPRAMIA